MAGGNRKRRNATWLITFADLMALLLTFFVMLISLSTIDAEKYDIIAKGLGTGFGLFRLPEYGKPNAVIDLEETGDIIVAVPTDLAQPSARPPAPWERENLEDEAETESAPAKELYGELAGILEAEIELGGVDLSFRRGAVVIRIDEKVSFDTGRAELVASFKKPLDRIRGILEKSPGQIVVSGHTDDRPISNSRFRSNWDLSTARAVSVVHYLLSDSAIGPARVTAQGHADTVPLAPNVDAPSRARNRRVEISISHGG